MNVAGVPLQHFKALKRAGEKIKVDVYQPLTLSNYCHYTIIEVHSAKRTVDDFAVKGIGLDSIDHTDNAGVEEYERSSGAVGNGEDSTENEEPNIYGKQEIVDFRHIRHDLSFLGRSARGYVTIATSPRLPFPYLDYIIPQICRNVNIHFTQTLVVRFVEIAS